MKRRFKVDFLNTEHDRIARRTTITTAVVFTLLVSVMSAIGAGVSYRSATHGTNVLIEIGNLPVIADLRRLVLGESANAKDPIATPDGRLNIMIFGIGGFGHEGSELTDTIILASIDTNDKKIGLLSIPRDIAFPLGNANFEKINAVNAYAELENPGQGSKIASKEIGKLLGVRIDHAVKIDFAGFVKFIDALGGLDINVERDFTDTSYPTLDDKWQTISFKRGQQNMDGARALIYVRSRHGNNGEGGDFARSRRQQQVMEAVRAKLFTPGLITSPQKISELWGIVSSHIQTDLSPWDMLKLANLARSFERSDVIMRVLTDEPDGELIPATVAGAFMLFPKKPDWSEIRALAQNPFETDEERSAKTRPAETISVEIKNGTVRIGFAAQVADQLKKNGYAVNDTGNAVQRGYEKTVLFDLTGGKKAVELARLKKLLDANVSTVLPAWLDDSKTQRVVYAEGFSTENIKATSTDFLIILGESSLGLIGTVSSEE